MMDELITRLEKATGPDRGLDAEIAKLVGAPHGPWEHVTVETRSISYVNEQALAYTASLDAAMTLVAQSDGWSVSDYKNQAAKSVMAFVHQAAHDGCILAHARTVAIALCIAALKARALNSEPSR